MTGEVGIKFPEDFLGQQQTTQSQNNTHNNKQRLINWLTLVAVVAYTTVAALQWCAIRKTNNLSKQAMHTSGRAWVGLDKVTPVSFEKGSDVDSDSRFLLTVTFSLRNYGHSAALHVRIFPDLEAADSSTTTSGICNDKKSGVYIGDVILPEQKRDIPYGVRITVADMEAALKRQNPVMGRNLMLSLRGCIEYIDDPTETVPHHTPFSYFVARKGNERYFTPDLQNVHGDDITLQAAPLYPGPTD